MSICPRCEKRVTNGANQTRRDGVRYHKSCTMSHYNLRLAKRKRKELRELGRASGVIPPVLPLIKASAIKRMYLIFKERAGLG